MNNSRLRTIHLEGQLKEVCGGNSTVQLVGDSIPVLISGLSSMFGDKVKEVCRTNNWHVYLNEDAEGNDIGEGQLNTHLAATKDVYILPAVEGSGRVGQIILGVILIVVGAVIIYMSGGFGTPEGLQAIATGATMIMGGLSTIYMSLNTPRASEQRQVDEKASFVFNGAANVVEQGGAVACVYGRFRVGSTVVSAGIDVGQMTGGWNGGNWGGGDGGERNGGYGKNPGNDDLFDIYAL